MSRIWDALQKAEKISTLRSNEPSADASPVPEPISVVTKAPAVLQLPLRDASSNDGADQADLKLLGAEEVHAKHLGRIVCHTDPTSAAADRFRLLRMRLRAVWPAGKPRTIVVTSPLPEDGKTTVALNLATALAEQRKRRVLFIDADLHRGCVCEQLGLGPAVGLTECLQDGVNPLSVIRRVEPLGWYLLSPGKRRSANPTELLRPQEVSNVLHKLTAQFDCIVVDTPPVLPLTDAISLSQVMEASLLVMRARRTPDKAVEQAISLIGRKHVIGVVVNGVQSADQPYSAYHNYYRRDEPIEPDPDMDAPNEPVAGHVSPRKG